MRTFDPVDDQVRVVEAVSETGSQILVRDVARQQYLNALVLAVSP